MQNEEPINLMRYSYIIARVRRRGKGKNNEERREEKYRAKKTLQFSHTLSLVRVARECAKWREFSFICQP